MSADSSWPTHAPPRITELTFAQALYEGPHVFPGVGEIWAIWKTLLAHGIDPSFALGHCWVESNFGTAGFNAQNPDMRAWGNILAVNSALLAANTPGVHRWSTTTNDGTTYTYAIYDSWALGVEDYALLIDQYRDTSPDARYGPTETIYGATAKWPAKVLGSPWHLNYMTIVLNRMDIYDGRTPTEGDVAILEDQPKGHPGYYRVKKGEHWYDKSDLAARSHSFSNDARVQFRGLVDGAGWAAVRLGTSVFIKDGASHPVTAYVPFDSTRLTT